LDEGAIVGSNLLFTANSVGYFGVEEDGGAIGVQGAEALTQPFHDLRWFINPRCSEDSPDTASLLTGSVPLRVSTLWI
jgi:hypothetical protein